MKTDNLRWLRVALCVVFAVLLLLGGWLIPAHLRAVDAAVLERAGAGRATLVESGLALARANNPDAAQLIVQAAQLEKIPGTEPLVAAIAAHPNNETLFPGGPAATPATPVTALIIRSENRQRILAYLEATGSPALHELLRARDLTNTVLFPASSSASGQAFDAALSLCGLLLDGEHLSSGLREAVLSRASSTATRADPQPLEEILLNLMSLGQRFTWGQLTVFVGDINDPATLTQLSDQARNAGAQLPVLFSIVALSQRPAQVAAYLNDFSQTGLKDLGASLRYGEGGLDELLTQRERLHVSSLAPQGTPSGIAASFIRAMADYTWRMPRAALALKWFLYLVSGFLFAAAAHFARPTVPEIEKPLEVRGFHFVRESLFALGFLLVVLLLSEPFLAQESQKAAFAFRLRLPVAGAAATSLASLVKTKLMDTRSLFTLALFFVLQALIYCACLAKLAEIRRQKVPVRVQLKLLENEEHLFDGGLYLGFAGTIICLILVSLGIIQQSLMAAYSSTSFGIIFVSIFKIFNLRPVRRRLLMESEMPAAVRADNPPVEQSLAGITP